VSPVSQQERATRPAPGRPGRGATGRQPGRLGLEQRQASSVVDLDEIRPVAVAHPPGLMDAPAADRLALAKGKWLAGGHANRWFVSFRQPCVTPYGFLE